MNDIPRIAGYFLSLGTAVGFRSRLDFRLAHAALGRSRGQQKRHALRHVYLSSGGRRGIGVPVSDYHVEERKKKPGGQSTAGCCNSAPIGRTLSCRSAGALFFLSLPHPTRAVSEFQLTRACSTCACCAASLLWRPSRTSSNITL